MPFEYHRFIIGLNGAGVKKLMNAHDVNIKVPNSEEQSPKITLIGPPCNVESAKEALGERCEEIKEKLADEELRSFEIKIDVNPEYHPKIIGRRGAKITQLRKDHNVNIQLPSKDDPNPSIIAITGYEANANAAKDAIMAIVKEYVSDVLLLVIHHFFYQPDESSICYLNSCNEIKTTYHQDLFI